MADQNETLRDLSAIVKAVIAWDQVTAYAAADRLTSALGLGEDDSPAAIEAGLREASGPVLNREQLGTALSALEDAADYRREHRDGDCSDCEALPEGKLCGDHDVDEAVASMYDLLHAELQEHQVRGEAATAAERKHDTKEEHHHGA